MNAAVEGVRSVRAALENLIGTTPDLLLRNGLLLDGRRNRLSRDEYLARLAFCADETHLSERRFFARMPERAPEPSVVSLSAYRGGEELLFRFESSYRAFNPVMASELARFDANRDGYLFLFRHDEGRPRPLVLCVHGFQMGAPERAKKLFRIAHLFDLGLDVALFIQPHHWRRAEHANNPFKQTFVNPHDVPLTIEALGQAVHDLRASYLLLESLGHTRIAMVGASLGGYACALHAVVDDSPECVYVAVPSLRMDYTLAPRRLKLGFSVDDEVREMTTRALELVAPANYAPTLSVDDICVVYHEADRIADARHTREWIARWGIEHQTALRGGHWAVFDRKARGRAWYAWLARHDFIAPSRRSLMNATLPSTPAAEAKARKRRTPASEDPFNEVEDVILRRRSVRAYRKKQVPEYLVKRVLECGRFAPSAGNNQSWKFVVIRDPELIAEMTEHTQKRARLLSRLMDPTYPGAFTNEAVSSVVRAVMTRLAPSTMHPTGLSGLGQLGSGALGLWHGAPTVILLLVDRRGTGNPYIDIGVAGQNMAIAAHSMGLGTCWVSFSMFLEQSLKYRRLLGIQYPMRLASSLALGFPAGQPDGLVARETHETTFFEPGGVKRLVY